MYQLFIYIFTIQWSPGPLNILALNNGLQGRIKKSIIFCIGIGLAMSVQYIVCGYGSQLLMTPYLMPWISGIGSLYILWLGYHLIASRHSSVELNKNNKILSFKDGFIMQLFNPKGFVAALPVGTIYFPGLNIINQNIISFSLLFGLICFGSVIFYTFLGHYFSKAITNPKVYKICNVTMGSILILLALSLDWEYIIVPLLQ